MFVKHLTYYWIFTASLFTAGSLLLCNCTSKKKMDQVSWQAPDLDTVPAGEKANQLRYGKDLIAHTSKYFGPKGSVASISNGMNCQNCHLDAGTRLYGNCFATVASTYPSYKERSNRVETIEFRILDCLQRSLNGSPIDSVGKEMQAMVAYIKWLGKDVAKGVTPAGCGMQKINFIDRACDTLKGSIAFMQKCQSCHTVIGEGMMKPDSTEYLYPPLWGPHSYNTASGMYRVSRLACFIHNNMPYTSTHVPPQLTDEEAWDIAGFICSQQRPEKVFTKDWIHINAKPVDYPFGPFADSFTAVQHKYGPYIEMQKLRAQKAK